MRNVRRTHPASTDSALASAGVGDQKLDCPNGNEGCSKAYNSDEELPCWECLQDGGAV